MLFNQIYGTGACANFDDMEFLFANDNNLFRKEYVSVAVNILQNKRSKTNNPIVNEILDNWFDFQYETAKNIYALKLNGDVLLYLQQSEIPQNMSQNKDINLLQLRKQYDGNDCQSSDLDLSGIAWSIADQLIQVNRVEHLPVPLYETAKLLHDIYTADKPSMINKILNLQGYSSDNALYIKIASCWGNDIRAEPIENPNSQNIRISTANSLVIINNKNFNNVVLNNVINDVLYFKTEIKGNQSLAELNLICDFSPQNDSCRIFWKKHNMFAIVTGQTINKRNVKWKKRTEER